MPGIKFKSQILMPVKPKEPTHVLRLSDLKSPVLEYGQDMEFEENHIILFDGLLYLAVAGFTSDSQASTTEESFDADMLAGYMITFPQRDDILVMTQAELKSFEEPVGSKRYPALIGKSIIVSDVPGGGIGAPGFEGVQYVRQGETLTDLNTPLFGQGNRFFNFTSTAANVPQGGAGYLIEYETQSQWKTQTAFITTSVYNRHYSQATGEWSGWERVAMQSWVENVMTQLPSPSTFSDPASLLNSTASVLAPAGNRTVEFYVSSANFMPMLDTPPSIQGQSGIGLFVEAQKAGTFANVTATSNSNVQYSRRMTGIGSTPTWVGEWQTKANQEWAMNKNAPMLPTGTDFNNLVAGAYYVSTQADLPLMGNAPSPNNFPGLGGGLLLVHGLGSGNPRLQYYYGYSGDMLMRSFVGSPPSWGTWMRMNDQLADYTTSIISSSANTNNLKPTAVGSLTKAGRKVVFNAFIGTPSQLPASVVGTRTVLWEITNATIRGAIQPLGTYVVGEATLFNNAAGSLQAVLGVFQYNATTGAFSLGFPTGTALASYNEIHLKMTWNTAK